MRSSRLAGLSLKRVPEMPQSKSSAESGSSQEIAPELKCGLRMALLGGRMRWRTEAASKARGASDWAASEAASSRRIPKRISEAETAFSEAAAIGVISDTKTSPAPCSSGICPIQMFPTDSNGVPIKSLSLLASQAGALENLGHLYLLSQRFDLAAARLRDALLILRQMEREKPNVALSSIADTLKLLILVYGSSGQQAQVNATSIEAIEILRELVKRDPLLYGDELAMRLVETTPFAACRQPPTVAGVSPCARQAPIVCANINEAARVAVSEKVKQLPVQLAKVACSGPRALEPTSTVK
jgi:tetratricopeptide (TPR) repeat protein